MHCLHGWAYPADSPSYCFGATTHAILMPRHGRPSAPSMVVGRFQVLVKLPCIAPRNGIACYCTNLYTHWNGIGICLNHHCRVGDWVTMQTCNRHCLKRGRNCMPNGFGVGGTTCRGNGSGCGKISRPFRSCVVHRHRGKKIQMYLRTTC